MELDEIISDRLLALHDKGEAQVVTAGFFEVVKRLKLMSPHANALILRALFLQHQGYL